VLTPIFLNCFFQHYSITTAVGLSNKEWLAFWGSYLGAIIMGLFTFLVLFFTYKQSEKHHKDNLKRLEDQTTLLNQQTESLKKQTAILSKEFENNMIFASPYLIIQRIEESFYEQNIPEKEEECFLVLKTENNDIEFCKHKFTRPGSTKLTFGFTKRVSKIDGKVGYASNNHGNAQDQSVVVSCYLFQLKNIGESAFDVTFNLIPQTNTPLRKEYFGRNCDIWFLIADQTNALSAMDINITYSSHFQKKFSNVIQFDLKGDTTRIITQKEQNSQSNVGDE